MTNKEAWAYVRARIDEMEEAGFEVNQYEMNNEYIDWWTDMSVHVPEKVLVATFASFKFVKYPKSLGMDE